jgi:hypothetical protein
MADFEFGTPQSIFDEKPRTREEAPSFQFGAPAALPEIAPTEVVQEKLRPITPKRMGQFLEQRLLPSLEQEQRRAEDERLSRAAGAQMELGPTSQGFQKSLAGFGSAADTMTAGVFPYIPAALAKGAGKLGVPGYERYADMPIVDVKKAAERKVQAASTLQPGAALTGQAAGLVVGAKMLPPVAPSLGPAASGALTGATYGGVSGLAQEGDPMDALKGAALGSVLGGVSAPVIERTASGLTRLVAGGKPVVTASGQLTDEALGAARAAGLTDDEIQRLGPYLQQTFEQRGVTPAAAREARFAEFGMTPTRGMVTEDAAQLAREKAYGTLQPLTEQAAEAARREAGGTGASLREAVEDAVARGSREAAKLKSSYESAYKAAEAIPGEFDRASISNVGERIRGGWASDPGKLDFYASDIARKAAQDLDSVLGAAIPTATPGVPVTHQTFRAVESGRKILNSALSAAKEKTDRAAVRKMIDDFDDHIDRSITNGAFSGDPRVLDQWRAARKLFSEYQNKFGVRKTGEEAGTLMKKILDGSKSSEEVGNMMFAFSSGDAKLKQDAAKAFLQLRRALGPNSSELEQIKKSYIQQLMTPSAAKLGEQVTARDFARTAEQINDTLRGRGASFTRVALTPAERVSLDRYAKVMAEAGRASPDQMPEKVNRLVQAAKIAVPAIASGASYALALVSPEIAGTIGGLSTAAGLASAARTSPMAQRYLATRAPAEVARPYRFPEVRTAIPLGTAAVPEIGQTVPPVLESLREQQRVSPEDIRTLTIPVRRPQRATGGAVNLRALANMARKAVTKSTENLLRVPDEHVVKALEVANRQI